MRILDLYIARTVMAHSLLAMGVLLGLFMFVTLVDQLREIGTGNYDIYAALRYVALSLPQQIYELFPMAVLLGAILGLSSLAVDSELIVMRASGVSLLQIAGSVLKLGVIFAVVAVLLGEFVTPRTETWAERGRAEALQDTVNQRKDYGLWMRDHATYISVGEVLPDLSLIDLRVFEFDINGRMRSAVAAAQGRFELQGRRWRLEDVRQSLFEDEQVRSVNVEAAYWSSALAPEILAVFLVKPEQLSAYRLDQYIEHLQENAQDTERYELAFWRKVTLPLSTAVMVFIAIPFVFRQIRSGGLGPSLFAGILLGLGFYTADKGFGYFILVYDIHPVIGALAPTLLFLVVALVMLRRVA
jgi:lipopolysaccharide export system permease protein